MLIDELIYCKACCPEWFKWVWDPINRSPHFHFESWDNWDYYYITAFSLTSSLRRGYTILEDDFVWVMQARILEFYG